jgi:hypothetical protein
MEQQTLSQVLEAGDLDALETMFADGVKFHSPVIHGPPFVGRAAVIELLGVILPEIRDLQVIHDATDGDAHILVVDGSILGEKLKATFLANRDAVGDISEIWVMIRPLRANARVVRVVGKGMTRLHSGIGLRAATNASGRGLVRYVDSVTGVASQLIRKINKSHEAG